MPARQCATPLLRATRTAHDVPTQAQKALTEAEVVLGPGPESVGDGERSVNVGALCGNAARRSGGGGTFRTASKPGKRRAWRFFHQCRRATGRRQPGLRQGKRKKPRRKRCQAQSLSPYRNHRRMGRSEGDTHAVMRGIDGYRCAQPILRPCSDEPSGFGTATGSTNRPSAFLLPPGEGARRADEGRSFRWRCCIATDSSFPHPSLRATFSRREKEPA